MESRFRVRCLRLLGILVAVIALASCGDDPTEEATSTAATSTTTTSSPTTAPSSTSTTSSSTTTAPSETTEAAADFDISVDADTEWRQVFNALTTTEQDCIRDSFEGDLLDSVLGRSVISESDAPEAWEVSMFSCLAPQTARAVFLALMVSGMEEDGVFRIDEDAEACLEEWVSGIDVVATIVALSADDTEAAGEITTTLMRCNPDLFISLMLEETGLTLEDLGEEEATCLREWAAGIDWATLLAGDDLAVLMDFLPDLFACAPDVLISSMLEETGLTLEDLSEEEATCLREWAAGIDWATLFTGFGEDPLYFLELLECVPDLSWSEPGDRPWDGVIDDATPVGIGVPYQGELDDEANSNHFAFETEQGQFYELTVTLGTLQDFILDLYDADGIWLNSNDGFGNTAASGLIWNAPDTGTYYVQVTSFGTGTYTLTIDPSDTTDDHPNSATDATPVESGMAAQGEIDYQRDSDYFAFEAEQGQFYQLDVTLGTLEDSVLDLYNAEGVWLDRNDDSADSAASRLIWNAPDTGTYYVQVTSFGTGTGTYTLTIDPSDIVDDHPNSPANAVLVDIGMSAQGEIDYQGDSDYFAFEAEEGEFYQLDVTLGTLEDSVLDLYDADGIWLNGNDDSADSAASRLIWNAPDTGTYYVQVTSFGAGTGTYTLTIGISDIVDDHPNSTTDATPVEIGVAAPGEIDYVGDSDYFAFEAEEGESYQLDVTLGTLQDSVLDLYDADGIWLDSNDNYGNPDAYRLTWDAPRTGTYYVQMSSYGAATGTYTLTIAPS